MSSAGELNEEEGGEMPLRRFKLNSRGHPIRCPVAAVEPDQALALGARWEGDEVVTYNPVTSSTT
jgi:hypothetical protein